MTFAAALKAAFRREGLPAVPWPVRFLFTAVAGMLLYLSVYHFGQPNQAWRSGTTELVSALALLCAAWLAPYYIALGLNLFIVIVVVSLGIRHFTYGNGRRSGLIELGFAVLLLAAAWLIWRARRRVHA